jgi:Xaa-Pro dipeptidase
MSSPSSYERVELEGLSPAFFLANRQNFIKNLKEHLVTLPENSYLFLMGGKEYPKYDIDESYYFFLQESNFYYLTGVLEANYYATINLTDASFSLYIPQPTETEKIFNPWQTMEQIAERYQCQTFDLVKLPQEVRRLNPNKLYVLNGTNSDSDTKVQTCDYVFPTPYDDLNEKIDHDELVYEILADTRTRKTQEEIDLMKYINQVTVEGHIVAMKKIYQNLIKEKKDIIERDVENYFHGYVRSKLYSRNHPYEHICGCGVDAATLHYLVNDQPLKDGQLILMDMGGLAGGYVSDVTSTVPVNGKFTEKQKQIYDIVLNANLEVRKNAKPGVSWLDMHLLAEKVILTGLRDLGLLSNEFTVDEMLNNRVAYYFMPHGLGHLMGIDTHDAGGYLSFTPPRSKEVGLSSLRTARYLEKNMILSDEPGIYFIPYLLEKGFNDEKLSKYFVKDKIKEYYDFGGVRIEDDILITEDGCVNLTEGLPRTTDEIERTMTEQ